MAATVGIMATAEVITGMAASADMGMVITGTVITMFIIAAGGGPPRSDQLLPLLIPDG